MNLKSSRTILILASIIAVGLLFVLSPSAIKQKGTLTKIRQEGLIRIGYSVEAPYVFFDEQGSLTGIEIEVAKKIASKLSIKKIEWYQTEFGSLISDLESGRFDAVVAGMFITPYRAQRVNFSEPTFRVRQALLVKKGNPRGLHSYEDVIKKSPIKIAVLHGSIEEAMIRQFGISDSLIIEVPDALTGRTAVESGIADGLALSSPTVRFMAHNQSLGQTEMVQNTALPSLAGRNYTGFGAVAFRKTDDDLHELWNQQLGKFIGSTEHRQMQSKFGFTNDELPGSVKTIEIISSGAK